MRLTAALARLGSVDELSSAVERGFRAYEAAKARLNAVYPDLEASFAPLQEALWWVIAVRDTVKRSGAADYEESLNAGDGLVVAGLAWARNLGHELVHAGEHHTGGASFPARFPLAFAPPSLRFLRAAEMPRDNGRQANQRLAFETTVAGREVREVFEEAERWMLKWQKRLSD